VQAIPVSTRVQSFSKGNLRFGVPSADSGHHSRSGFRIDDVDHGDFSWIDARVLVCVPKDGLLRTMTTTFKTVDLFAGPGGLAEGFSSLVDASGKRLFEIALSVEKEPSAFATLRLRSFTRQFRNGLPEAYYEYLAGSLTKSELIARYPEEWAAAARETLMLELGTEGAKAAIDPLLDALKADGETVLIGGPPCQAYSLVGRARNRGVRGYEPAQDNRHFLYKEYIRIIERLQPLAFVMENVKGILSSKVDGDAIFEQVLRDLRKAGGCDDTYTLVPLVANASGRYGGYIIRSEDYGIPQNRHRVILVGIRSDRAEAQRSGLFKGALEPAADQATVAAVLSGMPKLRSGLSKGEDTDEAWQSTVVAAFRSAATSCAAEGTWLSSVAKSLRTHAARLQSGNIPPRTSTKSASVQHEKLGPWLADQELKALPNHESRGHMSSDLARYAFAAVFTEVFRRSPKASEFPADLAPSHGNWHSGKFADRFRVQRWGAPSSTITSHISKDGHYFIHPDPQQCRSLTVREAARLQTFPDNYFFEGNRTQQFVQVGNAVPPLLAQQIALALKQMLSEGS
jgi:DNA (cytosine-5)-methyltransferase 1